MMQISFGKKIPLMKCNVKDINKNQFVPAYFSKYDCKDASDLSDLYNSCQNWCFIDKIIDDMKKKYMALKENYTSSPFEFYVLENEEGKKLGICETVNTENYGNIEYIVSRNNDKYKYAGQAMVAMVGKEILKRNAYRLYVASPAPSASGFYTEKCGFERFNENSILSSLFLEKTGIKKFINRFQERTNSKISDLKG